MSHDPSGQTVSLPTEQEAQDAYVYAHPKCITCKQRVCVRNDDGTSDCSSCSDDMGEALHDDTGVLGHVHDDCREKYVAELAVELVEDALKVRLPLGMAPWAMERARNVVTVLLGEFDIKIKERR